MDNVIALKLECSLNGIKRDIYPAVVSGGSEMVLIDCGYPGMLDKLEEAAAAADVPFEKLTGVIITHHDLDHMGGLAELKSRYPRIKILSSETEEKYINGSEKSLRLQQAERSYAALGAEQQPQALQYQKSLEAVGHAEIDRVLADGEVLPYCGGIKVIATPGHMPGHISLYHIKSRTLITGDAAVADHGMLQGANPQYTLDMRQAKESLKKFLEYKISTVICYHGGIVTEKIKDSLFRITG